MPHVSPNTINKKILEQIYKAFFKAATSRHVSQKDHQAFFYELLTPTEKIMLGKRLSAIILLSKGATPYQASKTLKLSQTTTAKLSVRIDKGLCNHIVKLWEQEQKGPIVRYFEELLKPLPRYGTSPATLLKDRLKD